MPKNGSKMAKNALNDPIFGVQALKTSYFLITNVIGPKYSGGKKVEKNIPPPKTPQIGHCDRTSSSSVYTDCQPIAAAESRFG